MRSSTVASRRRAPSAQGAPPKPQWEGSRVLKPWTGDLDGMVRRRTIRALVVYSKTFYFVDEGRQFGLSYEGLRAFEDDLNRKLKADHAKVRILFLPVAAKRGLDPNVWFNNVERVAAEKHGAETVTYVSHIYNYYIAYSLVAEDEEERRRALEGFRK